MMRFYDSLIEVVNDEVVISETIDDGTGGYDSDVKFPPEQAIIIAKEMERLARQIIAKQKGGA